MKQYKKIRFVQDKKSMGEISKKLTKQIQKGNATRAIKILTNKMQNEILSLNRETLNHLKLKHPEAKQASAEVLLDSIAEEVHPTKFEAIDEESLRQAALQTGGSGL